MPELYARPWKRVDEYSKLLVAYKDAIPKDHFDIHDINASFHSLGELQDLIGEVSSELLVNWKHLFKYRVPSNLWTVLFYLTHDFNLINWANRFDNF